MHSCCGPSGSSDTCLGEKCYLSKIFTFDSKAINRQYLSSAPRSSMSCHRLQRPVADWIVRHTSSSQFFIKCNTWSLVDLLLIKNACISLSFTCLSSRPRQIYQVCAQRWFSQTCHHRHLGSQVMLRFLSNARLDLTLTYPRFWSVCPHCCWRAILRWEKTWRSTQPVRSMEVMLWGQYF